MVGDDSSLSKRPMDRISLPLRQMGVGDCWSNRVRFTSFDYSWQLKLKPIQYQLPIASAQVVSPHFCALQAQGESLIIEKI